MEAVVQLGTRNTLSFTHEFPALQLIPTAGQVEAAAGAMEEDSTRGCPLNKNYINNLYFPFLLGAEARAFLEQFRVSEHPYSVCWHVVSNSDAQAAIYVAIATLQVAMLRFAHPACLPTTLVPLPSLRTPPQGVDRAGSELHPKHA